MRTPASKERIKRENYCSMYDALKNKYVNPLFHTVLYWNSEGNKTKNGWMKRWMECRSLLEKENIVVTPSKFFPPSLRLTNNIKHEEKENPTENERGDNLTQNNFSQQ